MENTDPRKDAADRKAHVARLVAPETDVERFYKERIDTADGSSLTVTALYEDYIAWCEENDREPLSLPPFMREFEDLGVQKAKIAGRVRYIGVSLRGSSLVTKPIEEAPHFKVARMLREAVTEGGCAYEFEVMAKLSATHPSPSSEIRKHIEEACNHIRAAAEKAYLATLK